MSEQFIAVRQPRPDLPRIRRLKTSENFPLWMEHATWTGWINSSWWHLRYSILRFWSTGQKWLQGYHDFSQNLVYHLIKYLSATAKMNETFLPTITAVLSIILLPIVCSCHCQVTNFPDDNDPHHPIRHHPGALCTDYDIEQPLWVSVVMIIIPFTEAVWWSCNTSNHDRTCQPWP